MRDGSKYWKSYNEETLQNAIEAVNNGMSEAKAAEKNMIPLQTLQYRLGEKFKKPTHGPNPIMTSDEENLLVKWTLECHQKGFPRRRQDVQATIKYGIKPS